MMYFTIISESIRLQLNNSFHHYRKNKRGKYNGKVLSYKLASIFWEKGRKKR